MARRAKYSVQQKAFATAVQGNTTTTIEVVPSTVVEGMRKVKHITVNATIYLLIRPLAFTTGQTFTLVATVRYAISLS